MTIFEISVKLECMGESNNSFASTFTSQEGFYECWEQIDNFKKIKFSEKPTITHVLNTASFNVSD
jgi:hypothetical protein